MKSDTGDGMRFLRRVIGWAWKLAILAASGSRLSCTAFASRRYSVDSRVAANRANYLGSDGDRNAWKRASRRLSAPRFQAGSFAGAGRPGRPHHQGAIARRRWMMGTCASRWKWPRRNWPRSKAGPSIGRRRKSPAPRPRPRSGTHLASTDGRRRCAAHGRPGLQRRRVGDKATQQRDVAEAELRRAELAKVETRTSGDQVRGDRSAYYQERLARIPRSPVPSMAW